jgi:hypothetical protein
MKLVEKLTTLADAIYLLYKNRVASIIITMVNSFACGYSFIVLNSRGNILFSLVPLLVFGLNVIYLSTIFVYKGASSSKEKTLPEVSQDGK